MPNGCSSDKLLLACVAWPEPPSLNKNDLSGAVVSDFLPVSCGGAGSCSKNTQSPPRSTIKITLEHSASVDVVCQQDPADACLNEIRIILPASAAAVGLCRSLLARGLAQTSYCVSLASTASCWPAAVNSMFGLLAVCCCPY